MCIRTYMRQHSLLLRLLCRSLVARRGSAPLFNAIAKGEKPSSSTCECVLSVICVCVRCTQQSKHLRCVDGEEPSQRRRCRSADTQVQRCIMTRAESERDLSLVGFVTTYKCVSSMNHSNACAGSSIASQRRIGHTMCTVCSQRLCSLLQNAGQCVNVNDHYTT